MRKLLLVLGGVVAVVVLAVVAVVAIQLIRSDDPDLATEAPPIPTTPARATGLDTADPTPTGAAAPVALPEGVRRFVVVPGGETSAKYVVEETLRGLVTNAVGVSPDITGEIYLTPEGLYDGAESRFQVDLRTLRSDEGMRDGYIRRNTLQADRFPFAEFVAESVSGFPTGYVEGEEVNLQLIGTLTVKGVSQPVTWSVKARQAGSTLTAVADLEINMTDFGIDPPSVPIATARDRVLLQVVLVAEEG